MIAEWLKRLTGREAVASGASSGGCWGGSAAGDGEAGGSVERSYRLARLGLAPAGGERAEPGVVGAAGADDGVAPAPTFRRDVGGIERRPARSSSSCDRPDGRFGRPEGALSAEGQRGPSRQGEGASSAGQAAKPAPGASASEPSSPVRRERKRATYRLPLTLLQRLRSASRRTGRYQYAIVVEALRAYLPRIEAEASAAEGEAGRGER